MKKPIKLTLLALATLSCAQASFAYGSYKDVGFKDMMPVMTNTPAWYAGFNVGESRTHDRAAPGSSDSVTQIGPAWSADLGYQFFKWYNASFAGEIGYINYYHSSETLPGVNVANTDHFGAYAALVGTLPLGYNFGILGKVGPGWSYAKKVFEATGTSASANDWSPFYAAGLSYNMTQNASLLAQWSRIRGNSKTGSTDLISLGVSYAFM